MKATQAEYFKPSPRSAKLGFAFMLIPLGLMMYIMKTTRVSNLFRYFKNPLADNTTKCLYYYYYLYNSNMEQKDHAVSSMYEK